MVGNGYVAGMTVVTINRKHCSLTNLLIYSANTDGLGRMSAHQISAEHLVCARACNAQ